MSSTRIAGRRASRKRAPSQLAAFDLLYRQERQRLLRLAVLFTQNSEDAEDLVQDAFVSLRQRWDSLADPSRAAGYLSVSVVNGARSLHRRRAIACRHLPKLVDPSGPATGDRLLLAAEHLAVANAVTGLPRQQQQVVALRYWAEMPDSAIADALGISPAAVRSHASRGLAKIARRLEETDDD